MLEVRQEGVEAGHSDIVSKFLNLNLGENKYDVYATKKKRGLLKNVSEVD